MTTQSAGPAGLRNYSTEAEAEHRKFVEEYGARLEAESRAIAKLKKADDVQKSNVEDAAEAIGTRSGRAGRIVAEIGLVIGGFGLGYLGNVTIANDFSGKNVLIFMIPIAVGAAMYAFTLRGRR